MTRKHFIALAEIINRQDLPIKKKGKLANEIAEYAYSQNEFFNKYLFLKACGVFD